MCLFLTGILFGIHYIFPSMLNLDATHHGILEYNARINHGFIQEVYGYHMQHPAFVRRPITSFAIDFFHRVLSISYANAFIFINFSILFLCGIVLFYLAKALRQKERDAFLGVLLFYVSFSVLFAFFVPVYSYDEPLQYLFLFLALLFSLKKQWVPFAVSFFLALMTRETSILLVPGFLFFLLPKGKKPIENTNYLRSVFTLFLTVGGYIGALWWFVTGSDYWVIAGQYLKTERFSHWMFNFQSWQYSLESIISFILVLGIPIAVVIAFINRFSLKKQTQKILLAFAITTLINSIFVFWAAKAQEARLFALPLVFLWPLLGKMIFFLWKFFQKEIQYVKKYIQLRKSMYSLFIKGSFLIIGTFLAGIFAFGVYKPINGAAFSFGYQTYLFLICILVLYFVVIPTNKK